MHSEKDAQTAIKLQHTLSVTVQHSDLGNEISGESKPLHGFPEVAVLKSGQKPSLDLEMSNMFIPNELETSKHLKFGRHCLPWTCRAHSRSDPDG